MARALIFRFRCVGLVEDDTLKWPTMFQPARSSSGRSSKGIPHMAKAQIGYGEDMR